MENPRQQHTNHHHGQKPTKKSKKNAHQNLSEPTPDEPLRWGGPIVSLEGDEVWVASWYECLVGWCFACGRNGHDETIKGSNQHSVRRCRSELTT